MQLTPSEDSGTPGHCHTPGLGEISFLQLNNLVKQHSSNAVNIQVIVKHEFGCSALICLGHCIHGGVTLSEPADCT